MAPPPRNPEYKETVKQSFAAQGLMHTLGASLLDVTHGGCVVSAPISATCAQQHGYAHAGATFAIGDSACGYAALSVQEPGMEVLTSEMKIHLLAPAAGQRIVAEGSIIKSGRRLVIAKADVYAETDAQPRILAATLLGTIIPVPV